MNKQKIGVIGSGIAGLSVAWLLGQKHDVTLIEKHANPGMGAFNLDFGGPNDGVRIDVPLRAFNSCYYTNLTKLYETIGVEMQRAEHSASYAHESLEKTYFAYDYLTWQDRSFPVLSKLKSLGLKSLPIVIDGARFTATAAKDLESGYAAGITIIDYLKSKKYSDAFIYDVFLPSFAAICTCSYKSVSQYPAEILIAFWTSGLLFNGIWRAKHGADDAIQRLLQNSAAVDCKRPVKQVVKQSEKVVVKEENGKRTAYDHIVIATQANQAKTLVETADPDVAKLLSRFQYERSQVVVHSDTALLPEKQEEWGPVNFLVDRLEAAPMASIWLNAIYPQLQHEKAIFQTWNPLVEPEPESILGQADFERPIVTLDSLEAIGQLNKTMDEQGRRIWYVGSYAKPGIPLLESAVQSAMSVSARLDAPAPWVF